jgi:hypothetical protein
MAQTVTVSLVQPRRFRQSKNEEYVVYKQGIQEMPVEHARAMGLLHRIVRPSGEGAAVVRDTFAGTFDEKLTRTLNDAGYLTLDDLRKASQDEILAVEGVGPAAYERIANALKGGK